MLWISVVILTHSPTLVYWDLTWETCRRGESRYGHVTLAVKFGHFSDQRAVNCILTQLMPVCAAGLLMRLQIERTWEWVVFHRAVMSWHHCLGGLTVYSENWARVLRLRETIRVQTMKVESLHGWGGKKYTHCVKRERRYLHLKFRKHLVIMSFTCSLVNPGLPEAGVCNQAWFLPTTVFYYSSNYIWLVVDSN